MTRSHEVQLARWSVFAGSFSIMYWLSDILAFPLCSYYPATGRLVWGFSRTTETDGPAMYWYGWIASAGLGAWLVSVIFSFLPETLTRRLSPALAWLVPALVIVPLIYSLKLYFR